MQAKKGDCQTLFCNSLVASSFTAKKTNAAQLQDPFPAGVMARTQAE